MSYVDGYVVQAGMAKMMSDPLMMHDPDSMPFDQRMIFGGFEVMVDE